MVAPAYCQHGRRLGCCMICKGVCRVGHDLTLPDALRTDGSGREACAKCYGAALARSMAHYKQKKHRDRRVRQIAKLAIGKRPPCPQAGHDLNKPGAILHALGGEPYCAACRAEGRTKRGDADQAAAVKARMVEKYLNMQMQLEREPRAWVREELRNQLAKMAKEMGRE